MKSLLQELQFGGKKALQNLKLIKQQIGDPDYICTTISQWAVCISQQNCNSSEASQPASQPAAGANFPNHSRGPKNKKPEMGGDANCG